MIAQWGSSEPPHSGTWDAWLDGYGATHTDTFTGTENSSQQTSFVIDDTAINIS